MKRNMITGPDTLSERIENDLRGTEIYGRYDLKFELMSEVYNEFNYFVMNYAHMFSYGKWFKNQVIDLLYAEWKYPWAIVHTVADAYHVYN